MKIKLTKFDMSRIRPDSTIACVGKRRSGKSVLIRDIMSHVADKLDFGIVMCGSDDTAAEMAEYIPSTCIYGDYNKEALDVLLKYQGKCVKSEVGAKNTYLVLDDCMYDKKSVKGKNMRELFMNGRHKNVFCMFSAQYVMDIPPDIRQNIDYLFVFRDNIMASREKVWRNFFGMFSDYKDFSVVMDSCTDGFGCMVLDTTVRSNSAEECVHWYVANLSPEPFQVGSPGIWWLHNMFQAGRDGGHESEEDSSTIGVAERMEREKRKQKVDRLPIGTAGIHAVEKT